MLWRFHQGPLRPLRHGSSSECAFESVVFSEPLEDDVEGALHLLRVMAVRDVGEDAPTRRLFELTCTEYPLDDQDTVGVLN